MIFLMRYWKHGIALFGALALIVLFSLWRFEVGHNKLQKAEISRMDEQIEIAALEINQCSKDKALSEGEIRDYQNANSALRRERDRLQRKQSDCVLPEPSGSSGVHSGTGNQLSGRNGIRTDWLYDFAGRAEQDRITGAACIKFMDQLYKSRGYND